MRLGALSAWGLTGAMAALAAALAAPGAEPPPPGDDPVASAYRAGSEALERGDWAAAMEELRLVVERRPWDDEAHNRLGYASRRSGDYDLALRHYYRALELNPYHRGALEYLGEAYLELGRPQEARQLLQRLEQVCRQAAAEPEHWREGCEEWTELAAAVEHYQQGAAAEGGEARSP